jgi:hypothetical protein
MRLKVIVNLMFVTIAISLCLPGNLVCENINSIVFCECYRLFFYVMVKYELQLR